MRQLFYFTALALFLLAGGHTPLHAALGSRHIRVTGGGDKTAPLATSRIFFAGGAQYAPADFRTVKQTLEFHVGEKLVLGEAEIEFTALADGYAYFLMQPEIQSAYFEGEAVTILSRFDPDQLNNLRVIPRLLKKGKSYHLRVRFTLINKNAKFENGGISFFAKMADVEEGYYFEAYGPSSFEDDAYSLSLRVKVPGTETPIHQIFANGVVSALGSNEWSITFPSYFSASSFFVHLTNIPLVVRHGTYQGLERAIPFTAYAKTAEWADEAFARLPVLFAELEETFGPYPHASYIAYMGRDRGGMEHAGASISSPWALGHELTHSWFARGVVPADGRAGWIDEAIASWRDHGYLRASSLFTRAKTSLGCGSAFQRFAVGNSYVDGRLFLSELDLLFAKQGGLKPILKSFFLERQRNTMTNEQFREFLERKTGASLGPLFEAYVCAKKIR